VHFKLYEGYIKGVNELNEKIAEMLKDGRVDQDEFPAYSVSQRGITRAPNAGHGSARAIAYPLIPLETYLDRCQVWTSCKGHA